MIDNFLTSRINDLKVKYPILNRYEDYHNFSILCIKYFFFNEPGISFDIDVALDCLTDGANDGGIDAIFNDPTSEDNDVIIVQSKFYDKTKLSGDDVVGEIFKISTTLKNLQNNKVEGYNEKLVTCYRHATSQREEEGTIRIYFFTSYSPKDKRERNKLERKAKEFLKGTSYELEVNFLTDINAQIELTDNGKLCVEYGSLKIDDRNNALKFNDSVIVNISALSLQDLYINKRNGLFGMNLRYYVRQKTVDKGIEDTIKKEHHNFWYYNNGLVIVCDDYDFDGCEIKLHNFSIINGGQTTNRIGHIDIDNDKDFFLQCKIVKKVGESEEKRVEFINKIAEATNSQKPIKKADLKANTFEQLQLKSRLAQKGVYYITKKGDKVPKAYTESYQNATLDIVGKLCLASVMQMPGSSRSNSKKMYNDDIYYKIFGKDAKEGVIADSLKIAYYYDMYVKNELKDKGFSLETELPMFKNGKSIQLACIAFLSKVLQGVFTYESIEPLLSNAEALKDVLCKTEEMESIIVHKHDNEKEIFYLIFEELGTEVLGDCYCDALEKAKEEGKTLTASDYLKVDNNYYKEVIRKLWGKYKRKKVLRENIDLVCK